MTPELVVNIAQNALWLLTILLSLMLVPGLIVGVLISMFQAATQINEMTLSFIPKLLITLFVVVVAGPWMLSLMTDYTLRLFIEIPELIG